MRRVNVYGCRYSGGKLDIRTLDVFGTFFLRYYLLMVSRGEGWGVGIKGVGGGASLGPINDVYIAEAV